MPSISNEGEQLGIKWQVTQVSRSLLSVSKLSLVGYDIDLGDNGGTIRNRRTGRTRKVYKRHGIYALDVWVPNTEASFNEGFTRRR